MLLYVNDWNGEQVAKVDRSILQTLVGEQRPALQRICANNLNVLANMVFWHVC